MPWLSDRQRKWGHTQAGEKALGGPEAVHEWDTASERKPHVGKWLGKAIKHPGALTAAAKENGVSKLSEAEKESHSGNPHIRGRGLLGVRLIKKRI